MTYGHLKSQINPVNLGKHQSNIMVSNKSIFLCDLSVSIFVVG
jgi:hypothetical protein